VESKIIIWKEVIKLKEKLLKRAYTLLIFSVNSIIILILTTIKYKSKFDEMKSYSEIFINPNYKF